MYTNSAKMEGPVIVQVTTNLTTVLRSSFDEYSLNARVWRNLPHELSVIVLRQLKDFTRNDIIKMIGQKKTDISIALMDILETELKVPNRLPKSLQETLFSLEQAQIAPPQK